MQVVRQSSAHLSFLDLGKLELLASFLRILNGLKHQEGVVKLLEKWSFDADLARTYISFVVVGNVEVAGGSGEVRHKDHSVSILVSFIEMFHLF